MDFARQVAEFWHTALATPVPKKMISFKTAASETDYLDRNALHSFEIKRLRQER
jgi:hypothetical protein